MVVSLPLIQCNTRASIMFAMLLVVVAAAPDFVDLKLQEGTVTGLLVENHSTPVARFLGVPFAGNFRSCTAPLVHSITHTISSAPPTGENRWQPPQKLANFGFRQALKYGHTCVQTSNAFSKLTEVSEDCLYLNGKRFA
jgi:carboxylesterase type B